MQQCKTEMVTDFTVLPEKRDHEMPGRSEKALNNEMRHRYQETLYELNSRREELQKLFYGVVRAGFCKFAAGTMEAGRKEAPAA